jgi:hypothetical protein
LTAAQQTDRQQLLGAVEATEEGLGRLRLRRVADMSKATSHTVVDAAIQPGSQVHTDGWVGFTGLEAYDHRRFIPDDPYDGGKDVPRIHLVFSNLKRMLNGMHAKVTDRALQTYLDVFYYRFNRRGNLGQAVEEGIGLLGSSKPARR